MNQNEDLEKLKLNLNKKINNEKNMSKLLEIKKVFRTQNEINKDITIKQEISKKQNNTIKYLKNLSLDEVKHITNSYAKTLTPIEWMMGFSEDKFKELNKDLIQYVPFGVPGISNKFFKTLNKEKLFSIPTNIIIDIFNSFIVASPQKINDFLTDEQAYYLVNYDNGIILIHINKELIKDIIINKADNYLRNKLKTLNISKMTANEFKNIPANMLNHLTNNQIDKLTNNQLNSIANNIIKSNKIFSRKFK